MNKDILKHRIVGSIALVSFFVILIPITLEYKEKESPKDNLPRTGATSDEVGLIDNKSQNKSLFVISPKQQKKPNATKTNGVQQCSPQP